MRLCLVASAIIDCNVFLLAAKTAFLLCAISRFCRFRVFAVFAFTFFPVFALGVSAVFAVFAFSRFRVPPAASPRPGHRFRVHSWLPLLPFLSFSFDFVRFTSHFSNRELLKTTFHSRMPGFVLLKPHDTT